MDYLISAYAIDPYLGSESGVGWNWVLQYEQNYKPGDHITVLTRTANAEHLQRGMKEFGVRHIEMAICDVPSVLNWYREKYSVFHHIYYAFWQHAAWRWLKKSGRHYDVIHHVTWGEYRIPSELYRAEDAYTIWGPVGGAQVTPNGLKKYDTATGKFREFINIITVINPLYVRKIRKFSKIFASNIETYETLSKVSPSNCRKLVEIGGRETGMSWSEETRKIKSSGEEIVLLFVGRLIKKKGVEFLIEVIAHLPRELNYVLKIYGEGALEERLKAQIDRYGLERKILMMGAIPHEEIAKAYMEADVFLMPSLRETGGMVLVEAMSYCLPIVALDHSFCHELRLSECGLFVDTKGNLEEITDGYVRALMELIENADLREKLGKNGFKYMHEQLTWEHKYQEVYRN